MLSSTRQVLSLAVPRSGTLRVILTVLILLAAIAGQERAGAVIVDDLYQAKVYLQEGKADAENRALEAAFKQVLVKISGDSQVVKSPAVKQNTLKYRHWVNEFGRIKIPNSQTANFREADRPGQMVQFNRNLLLNWMKQNKLPIWPANRPKLLIWPVIQQWNGDKRFLSQQTDLVTIKLLEYVAEKRGLPVEIAGIYRFLTNPWTADEAWDLNAQALAQASVDYASNLNMVIRFSTAEDGSSLGTAFILEGQETYLYSAREPEALALFDTLIGNFVDEYSKKKAFISDLSQQVQLSLVFINTRDYGAYTRLRDLISSLEMIDRVQLVKIVAAKDGSSRVHLQINYQGDESSLIKSIQQLHGFKLLDMNADLNVPYSRKASNVVMSNLHYVFELNFVH